MAQPGGKDDRIFRQVFRHFGEVAPGLEPAVAAGHDHEALDGAALDRLHDLVRQLHDLVMGKAADDLAPFDLHRGADCFASAMISEKSFGLAVRRLRDVLYAGVSHLAGGEDAVLVGILRRDDAVCRHEDRSAELLELFVLLPPGVAVVADR